MVTTYKCYTSSELWGPQDSELKKWTEIRFLSKTISEKQQFFC